MNCYRFLADLVVTLHLAFVIFVVFSLPAILLGLALRWRWVRNFWFRAIHLLMIAIVAAESILRLYCPLTTWEGDLREKAGETVEQGAFVARLIHKFMFWDVPPAVLITLHCIFFLLVLIVFIFAPPRWPWKKEIQR
jgi:hypothetical protein